MPLSLLRTLLVKFIVGFFTLIMGRTVVDTREIWIMVRISIV